MRSAKELFRDAAVTLFAVMQHLFVMQAGDPLSEDGLPNVKSCVSTYMPTINKVLYSSENPFYFLLIIHLCTEFTILS
jgi:hypothetical protein